MKGRPIFFKHKTLYQGNNIITSVRLYERYLLKKVRLIG